MQYLVNDKGANTAVSIPNKEKSDSRKAKKKIEILKGIESALRQVSEIKKGNLPEKTLKEFLDEL
jgi:hypothetical protein